MEHTNEIECPCCGEKQTHELETGDTCIYCAIENDLHEAELLEVR